MHRPIVTETIAGPRTQPPWKLILHGYLQRVCSRHVPSIQPLQQIENLGEDEDSEMEVICKCVRRQATNSMRNDGKASKTTRYQRSCNLQHQRQGEGREEQQGTARNMKDNVEDSTWMWITIEDAPKCGTRRKERRGCARGKERG